MISWPCVMTMPQPVGSILEDVGVVRKEEVDSRVLVIGNMRPASTRMIAPCIRMRSCSCRWRPIRQAV